MRSIDDTVTGTADGPFRYAGGWVAGDRAGAFQDSFHYARSTGASATVTFSGVGARLWYSTALNFGKFTVRIDGGPTVILDQSSQSAGAAEEQGHRATVERSTYVDDQLG